MQIFPIRFHKTVDAGLMLFLGPVQCSVRLLPVINPKPHRIGHDPPAVNLSADSSIVMVIFVAE